MVFAIPGVIAGMLGAAIMNAGVRAFLFYYCRNTLYYGLSRNSIVVGLTTGMLIPIVSNILPIRQALGKNLRSSLDLNHRATNELSVQVTRLSEIGVDASQIMMALLLIGLGVGCYYGAPVSFLYENFRFFFLLLQLLLLFMIIGLTLLSMLIQPFLESALAFIMTHLCCTKDRKLHSLLTKNLSAHRTRNLKTATMFACTLAFLIFAGTTF